MSNRLFWLLRRRLHGLPSQVVVSPAVRAALDSRKGVVALESTVITHGLPYPQNLETAWLLEETVNSEGSVPATTALLGGRIHIGLSSEQLTQLAESKEAVKVSRRDIAHTLNKGLIGGTTVAATMYLAHMVGIRVFATGGIGGVHRGADQTFDISADLIELMRTPVTVVCAGVKSILDIPKTIEFLETHSVSCIVYGKQNTFPGFFVKESDAKGQFCTEDLKDVVRHMDTSAELGLRAGTILACPIPEALQGDGTSIEKAVQQALTEARRQNVVSKDVTPFLLSRVNQLTSGESMRLNIGLLENNARIGGQLARMLAEPKFSKVVGASPEASKGPSTITPPKIVVVGATVVDIEAMSHEHVKNDGGTYRGKISRRCGGVGRNHADALTRLGCDVSFISAVGDDEDGRYFLETCSHIDCSHVAIIRDMSTAKYVALNIAGEVSFGICNVDDVMDRITPQLILSHEELFSNADYVLFDGNITALAMQKVLELCNFYRRKAWFEPTAITKVCKIFDCGGIGMLRYASPNALEFREMVIGSGLNIEPSVLNSTHEVCEFVYSNPKVMHNLDMLIITLGANGSTIISRKPDETFRASHVVAPIEREKVVSVSGAGDSLNSGILAGLGFGLSLEQSILVGSSCAALTLQTIEAVSPIISKDLISS